MKEIMKLFAQERKNIERVAHVYGGKFTNVVEGVTFEDIFTNNTHSVMEPVFDAMKACNHGWFTDILYDYDNLKLRVKDLDDEPKIFYAIGVRDCGCDSANTIDLLIEVEGWQKCQNRYKDVFFFVSDIDCEPWLGKNARAIDVYHLHIGTK